MKDKLDIKMIFILVLAGALILSWIFRPSKKIDEYEDEIELLEQRNQELLEKNDSLSLANDTLDIQIKEINEKIDSAQTELNENKERIKDLENDKGKVSDRVRNLNADGVAKSLSEYIERSKRRSNIYR